MQQQVILRGQSRSTFLNYIRSVAKMALYFKVVPTDIPDEKINEYLVLLNNTDAPSASYFKHTVYGLRYAFRLLGREDRAIRLPAIKRIDQLPVVLSRAECRLLFKTPRLLKHRLLLCLIYSAGLRISEVAKLRIRDLDFDRGMIHIRQSKYNKDRYVPLSALLIKGLNQYFDSVRPVRWLFNGRATASPISHKAIQWTLRETVKKTAIQKPVTVHTLRHSYATHLMEDGIDIHTLMQLLGHEHVQTTMVYLHVARLERKEAHSPLDTLYASTSKT